MSGASTAWTALMHATHRNQLPVVRVLLDGGADPDRAVGEHGSTPLVAAVRGTPDIDRFTMGSCQAATVRAILKAAPDLKLPDNSLGKSARWWSWFGTCREVEQLLAGATPQGR